MILADQIIERDVSELVPYANNSRKHTEEQITAIASSIKEFGFLQPIIVDGESVLVAGHARLDAAKAAIKRFQNLTGIDAIHVETGKTYNEMRGV